MKNKKLIIFITLMLVLSFCVAFTACKPPDKYYAVRFASNGGEHIPLQNIKSGGKVTKPEDPVNSNTDFTFAGWYTDSTYDKEFDFENETITKDTYIYVKWDYSGSEELKFTVTYDYQGGKGDDETCEVIFGEFFTFIVPTYPNDPERIFGGWFSEAGGKGVSFTNASGVSEGKWGQTSNATAYAYWIEYKSDKKKAPNFKINDFNDLSTDVRLSDFYGKETLLISVFGTGCGYCITEMDEYFNDIAEIPGVRIIAVAYEYNGVSFSKFLNDHKNYNFPIYKDPNDTLKDFFTGQYPANYIVDKWGYLYTWKAKYGSNKKVYDFDLGTISDNNTFNKFKTWLSNAKERAGVLNDYPNN